MGFHELCVRSLPSQVTLVPDDILQITSDHGWQPGYRDAELKDFISSLKENHLRTSLFIDPNIKSINLSKDIGTKCVELHTGKLSTLVKKKLNYSCELEKIKKCALLGKSLGIDITSAAAAILDAGDAQHIVDQVTTKIAELKGGKSEQ